MLQQTDVQQQLLPPRADSDGTLRRIYEAALVRFAERGYHGVSMREIAQGCGIQASSIYAHFESKEQILHDLIVLGHEFHRDAIRDALMEAGSDPADQLRTVTAAHVRFHAEYPVLAVVANNELHALSESSAADVHTIRDEGVRTITEVIERGVKLGAFHCDDAFLATAVIGAAGIRVAVWFPASPAYSVEHVCEQYVAFALKLVS